MDTSATYEHVQHQDVVYMAWVHSTYMHARGTFEFLFIMGQTIASVDVGGSIMVTMINAMQSTVETSVYGQDPQQWGEEHKKLPTATIVLHRWPLKNSFDWVPLEHRKEIGVCVCMWGGGMHIYIYIYIHKARITSACFDRCRQIRVLHEGGRCWARRYLEIWIRKIIWRLPQFLYYTSMYARVLCKQAK